MSAPAHMPRVEAASARMRIGEWTVDAELRRLQKGDQVHRVSPKAMAVLVRLADRPGEVVSREDLLATVWSGTLPTDDVLTHAITELRRVFGDHRTAPRYIETIPKTGYRLIAPLDDARAVRPPELSSGPDGWRFLVPLAVIFGAVSLALLASAGTWLPWPERTPSTGVGLLDLGPSPLLPSPGGTGNRRYPPGVTASLMWPGRPMAKAMTCSCVPTPIHRACGLPPRRMATMRPPGRRTAAGSPSCASMTAVAG